MKPGTFAATLALWLGVFSASICHAETRPPQVMPFLAFPLECGDQACAFTYTDGPFTRSSINSVLDHSMQKNQTGFWQYGTKATNGADGVIVAFDGNRAAAAARASDTTCVGGGWTTGSAAGLLNSNGCGSGFISYDEHPGYDYRAARGTPVKASAAGHVLNIAGERCYKSNIAGTCEQWGYVGIDHGNGYISQYGHLDEIRVTPGESVSVGQVIGLSGNKAPVAIGPHLHFEVLKKVGTEYVVVDPYGWTGSGLDPLYSAAAIQPVSLWLPVTIPAGTTNGSANDGVAGYKAKDYARAFPLLQTGCEKRDFAACAYLGEAYLTGNGVAADVSHGIALSRQSCDKGNMVGCNNLGAMYYTGKGVTKDYLQAVPLFERACDSGEMFACVNLGGAYLEGNGVTRDEAHAVALITQACDQGEMYGCYVLGTLYQTGRGVTANISRAVALEQQACNGGDMGGCMFLATYYLNGQGVPRDGKRAANLYQQACDGGNLVACNNLASLYEKGSGVGRNLAHAKILYQKACDRQLEQACTNLKALTTQMAQAGTTTQTSPSAAGNNPSADPINCDAIVFDRTTALPSEAFAKAVLCTQIAKRLGSHQFQILYFKKIDGLSQVINGAKVYTMSFGAEIEYTADLQPQCIGVIASVQCPTPGGLPRAARRGDRWSFQGNIQFTLYETGWRYDPSMGLEGVLG